MTMPTTQTTPPVLESPLAERVAAHDWAATPLGSPATWSTELRTSLNICLTSRFPIIIFWGPEFVQIYNDAYRPILGDKHPRSLGQAARDCWPEIWAQIGPMLQSVLETGEATWSDNLRLPIDRSGTLEECYFTFSFSPIAVGGANGGVFCVVTETTAIVQRDREAALLARTLEQLTHKQQAEHARADHLNFLSAASDVYLASIEHPIEVLSSIAKTAVPRFADWCGVYVRDDATRTDRPVAVNHIRPEMTQLAWRMHVEYPLLPGGPIDLVISKDEPLRFDAIDATTRAAAARDERHAGYLERFALTSMILIPLRAFGKAVGAITFATSTGRDTFGDDDYAVAMVFAKRMSLAYENALLYAREHRVADALQTASLPRALPSMHGVDLHAVYLPGREEALIGGDWYDAFRLNDGRLVVSIGDVAGNGIDAAVTMSSMRQILRGTAQVHADPVLMLNAADRALRLEDPDRFVTAFVGVYDPIDGELVYANAGHPPPYLRHPNGDVEELSFIDPPLGLRQASTQRSKSIPIAPGSLIVFYTDGVIETTRDIEAGFSRLQSLIAAPDIVAAADPAQHLRETMLADGATDDVAILTMLVQATASENGASSLRRWTAGMLDPQHLSQFRKDLRLALVAEAFVDSDVQDAEFV